MIVSAMEYCVHRRQHGRGGRRDHHPRDRAGAANARRRLIIVSASGGARMMEGVISLMQLAKISAALARLDDAKVPYISVLDRSDHRRRDGVVRHAGRSEYRRAGRA